MIDQAAEIIGAAKELFKAFEDQLGEVMATQRLASKETHESLVQMRRALEGLLEHAKRIAELMRRSQEELRQGWQLHVAENSKAAGREMARAFGAEIAAGLEQRLKELAYQAELATRRLSWKNTLAWALGLAIAIPLTIDLGIRAFMPTVEEQSVPGLSVSQTHDVLARITACFPHRNDIRDAHACVATDYPPHLAGGM